MGELDVPINKEVWSKKKMKVNNWTTYELLRKTPNKKEFAIEKRKLMNK